MVLMNIPWENVVKEKLYFPSFETIGMLDLARCAQMLIPITKQFAQAPRKIFLSAFRHKIFMLTFLLCAFVYFSSSFHAFSPALKELECVSSSPFHPLSAAHNIFQPVIFLSCVSVCSRKAFQFRWFSILFISFFYCLISTMWEV